MKSKLFYGDYIDSVNKRIFNQVEQNYQLFSKHLIIVPERFTLNAESLLLDSLSVESTFKCEVLSINRLCQTLNIEQNITKLEGVLLVYKLILQNEDKLKFFRLQEGRLGFAEEIYETFMQFKSCGLLPKEINVEAKNYLLSAKLTDIKILYELYQNYLTQNQLFDGSDKVSLLSKEILVNPFFEDCAVYFIGFESMTALNLALVDAFVRRGNTIFAGALLGKGKLNEHIYLNDVYQSYQDILSGVDYDSELVPNKLSPIFKHILDNCFAYSPNKYEISGNVLILKCEREIDEVKKLKQHIHSLLIDGYRYNDINVLVSNIEVYKELISSCFLNDIPYYIDSQNNLEGGEVARLILTIFEGVKYGFGYEDWFRLVNNYFFGLDVEQRQKINNLINYLRPNGFGWLKQSNLDVSIVQKLVDLISKIKECKNANDFISASREVLDIFNIEQSVIELYNNLDDLYHKKLLKKSFDVMIELFNMLEKVCQGVELNLVDYIKLLKNGLAEAKINLVPLSVDSVFIGDLSSSFMPRQVVLVLGAKYGELPNVKDDCGILNDKDLDNVSERYKIEPKVSEINTRTKLKVLQTIIASNKLYITYPMVSGDAVNKPSMLIEALCNCLSIDGHAIEPILATKGFTDIDVSKMAEGIDDFDGMFEQCLKEEDNSITTTMKSLLDEYGLSSQLERFQKQNEITYIKSKPFFTKGYTSISQLKEYFDCPYKHFLNRALKIKKIEPLGMRNIEVGNILHRVAELYCIASTNGDANEIDIINIIKNEFKDIIAVTNPVVVCGLLKEAKRLMRALKTYMQSSKYVPTYFEYSFANVDAKLTTKYGEIEVRGKVDRIDVYNDRFFVVDYKTSNKKIDAKGLYYGTKLQLPFYSYYFAKAQNKGVTGFGYFPIVDNFDDVKNYCINGLYIKDIPILKELDNNMTFSENEKSKFFDFKYIVPITTVPKLSSNCLEQGQLNLLCKYAYQVCVKAVEEIIDGYIAPSPNTSERICDYCDYQGICQKEINAINRVEKSIKYDGIENIIKGDA